MSYGDSPVQDYEDTPGAPMRGEAELARAAKMMRRPDQGRGGVERQVDELRSNVAEMEQVMDDLGSRINVVLRPSEPSPALASLNQDAVSTSTLADALTELSYRVSRLCSQGRDLTARVDL